jgi:D-tyrosyl-tRNA(Tyr) deacylase
MRLVIQKVTEASVAINNKVTAHIGRGLLILLGIEEADTTEDINWLVKKTSQLRIFDDENGIMNKSVLDIKGELIVVSQFTLHANTKKGNRPSYIRAARPETAIPLYEEFITQLQAVVSTKIQTGQFGAMMQVSLINDGPVTILIDSKNKDF